jgi:hypothetical protein
MEESNKLRMEQKEEAKTNKDGREKRKLDFMLTHSLTHGAEPFLKNRQWCSYSRISQ